MRETQIARKTIHEFVRTTRLRRRIWFTIASLTTHGLFVGVALYLIDWALPAFHPTALWIGLGWLVVVLAWHLLHPGLSLRVADGTLGLQDRLLTWWSIRDRDADAATRWLEDDLSHSLADLPPEARTQLWRRPARRLLWALPLLFVVWVIGPIGRQFFLPSPVGVTEQKDAGPVARKTNEAGDATVADRPDPDSKQPQKPQPKQSDPKQPPGGDQGKQPPPKPVHLLPGTEAFVIPPFVGEGDGKLQKTRIAVLQDGGADNSTGSGGRTGTKAVNELRRERAREYRRAEERALRSRHVPARERGFVRRYFNGLLRGRTSRQAPKK